MTILTPLRPAARSCISSKGPCRRLHPIVNTPCLPQRRMASRRAPASTGTLLGSSGDRHRPSGQWPHVTSRTSYDPSSANSRLSLISRHLDHSPSLELNTPYSTERRSSVQDDLEKLERQNTGTEPKSNMSSQPSHPALLIPGPIEFDDEVLHAMGHFR